MSKQNDSPPRQPDTGQPRPKRAANPQPATDLNGHATGTASAPAPANPAPDNQLPVEWKTDPRERERTRLRVRRELADAVIQVQKADLDKINGLVSIHKAARSVAEWIWTEIPTAEEIESTLYRAVDPPADREEEVRNAIRGGIKYGIAKPNYDFSEPITKAASPAQQDCASQAEAGSGIVKNLADSNDTEPPQLKPRFNLISLETLSQRLPPIEIISKWIAENSSSLWTAKHANFKTFILRDVALCVATGTDFHGYPVKQGHVVYVVAEGAGGFWKRCKAWMIENGIAEIPTSITIIDEPVAIHDPAILRAFIEQIKPLGPILIILDTFARCAIGLDENSARDSGAFMEGGRKLSAETGAHIAIVHHNNRSGEFRGSSALAAAVDTHLSLERNAQDDTLTIKFEKQKDSEELPPQVFTKHVVELHSSGLEDSLVFRRDVNTPAARFSLSNMEQRALEELVQSFGLTGATSSAWWRVCKEAGIAERTFRRAQQKLHQLAIVICPDPGKRGAIYRPNPDKVSDWCQSVPNGAIGTNGTDPSNWCQTVPPPFRGGTNGTDGHQPNETSSTDDDEVRI